MSSLQALFSPRSVAVIGASRTPGTIGNAIFNNLIRCGFAGVAYPVNPRAQAVLSVKAWPSIGAVPEPVDLAIIALPAEQVNAAVRECAEAGVQALVVISAGFKEGGGEGAVREAELVEVARGAGMRVVGPNCLGVINADPAVALNATFAPTWPHHGRIGFLTQSGALGVAILDYGLELGLGVSTFVSVGNKADLSANDMLEHWEQDAATDIILLYLESFGNPRKFNKIARRVARRKPVLAVKSGRSAAGSRAASSHTGSLAGVDVAADALFWQTGVLRVDTLEQLFNTAMLLAHQPIPRGPRVAILTNAGGPGILAADACETFGLELPSPSAETQAALRAFLPAEASVANPVDMIASASASSYEQAVRLLLADPAIDSLLVIFVPPIVTHPQEVAEAILRGARGSDKPVLCNFLGTHGIPESLRSLKAGSIVSYAFPETAAISLAQATRYGQWLQRPEGQSVERDDLDAASARAAVEGALRRAAAEDEAVWLAPEEVEAVLRAYGIPTARALTATTPEEAAAAAQRLGFPVAVKLMSETITHKTEVQGVRLGLESPEQVFDAFAGIARRLADRGQADAMAGVVVQEMVTEGVEVILGASLDPAFGPVLMVGLGGIHVELLKDVSVRVHPLHDIDVDEMLGELRALPLLTGYRGQAPADVPALREALLRLDLLVRDLPELVELDINPLKVRAAGQGVIAVDARICVQRTVPRRAPTRRHP